MDEQKMGNLASTSVGVIDQITATPRMDPELKAKWVEALRSGKYEQCKGALHDGVGFCCIGVLGDALGLSREVLHSRRQYLGPDGRLSPELVVLNAVPLSDRQALATKNDCGKSFSEIADWIEENL